MCWIFLPQGFFSIVADGQQPGRLVIRARIRGDLETLRADLLPQATKVQLTPTRDYPMRIFAPRRAVAAAMSKAVMEIQYTNFKAEILARQGLGRELLYAKVHRLMADAEDQMMDLEAAHHLGRLRRS